MNIFKLFRQPPPPKPAKPATAIAQTTAQPLVVNPDAAQKIEHAEYRAGAIRRYIEQTPSISAAKMMEFRHEMREHALTLLKAGKVDEAGHDALIALTKGA